MSTTNNASHSAYGVTKPVGHVLVSFPSEDDARAARDDLQANGFRDADITLLTAGEMEARTDRDIHKAGVLASIGQELNLVKAQHELARAGHAFLSVAAPDDAGSRTVAHIARRHGADRAQRYGRFIIEELIMPGTEKRQVAESPDLGLDAQTRSGKERA